MNMKGRLKFRVFREIRNEVGNFIPSDLLFTFNKYFKYTLT